MKKLYIVRGLPHSGKSTLATELAKHHTEADKFMIDKDGNYAFDFLRLQECHKDCQEEVREWMIDDIKDIAVANTFTQEWEMGEYFDMAGEYGYQVTVLIVEKYHTNKNDHNVPEGTMKKMKDRFEVNL